jgi:large subunit ribosomal protein L10e
MGNPSGDFDVEISLVGLEKCQIRHQALEAARIAANRSMQREVGRNNYHLRVRVKPFHYLRENRMMTGANADRVQQGMRMAFGRVIGVAARVNRNQSLITIRCNPKHIKQARTALKKAEPKLPTPCRVEFEKIDTEVRKRLGYSIET